MIPLDQLQPADFSALTGQPFGVKAGGQGIELILQSVTVLGHRRADAARDPFSLLFQGPPRLRLQQGVYAFENQVLGTLEIFITQIGDGAQGSTFEAIFT